MRFPPVEEIIMGFAWATSAVSITTRINAAGYQESGQEMTYGMTQTSHKRKEDVTCTQIRIVVVLPPLRRTRLFHLSRKHTSLGDKGHLMMIYYPNHPDLMTLLTHTSTCKCLPLFILSFFLPLVFHPPLPIGNQRVGPRMSRLLLEVSSCYIKGRFSTDSDSGFLCVEPNLDVNRHSINHLNKVSIFVV